MDNELKNINFYLINLQMQLDLIKKTPLIIANSPTANKNKKTLAIIYLEWLNYWYERLNKKADTIKKTNDTELSLNFIKYLKERDKNLNNLYQNNKLLPFIQNELSTKNIDLSKIDPNNKDDNSYLKSLAKTLDNSILERPLK